MENIVFNFTKTNGIIKPMNAVNNGPTTPGVRKSKTNFDAYKAAKFPFARNHDASFYTPYGGEHIVDVHRIFKNFDADENDPESYIFEPTDDYLKTTMDAGTKVFYRLGAAIEHRYKYGTRVPKDFAKWARICEHIIMHYPKAGQTAFIMTLNTGKSGTSLIVTTQTVQTPAGKVPKNSLLTFSKLPPSILKIVFPTLKLVVPPSAEPGQQILKRTS